MAGSSLEERISALEEEIGRLKDAAEARKNRTPLWEQRWGWAENDPHYAGTAQLDREYRESLGMEGAEGVAD
jgi:hypothetical protein